MWVPVVADIIDHSDTIGVASREAMHPNRWAAHAHEVRPIGWCADNLRREPWPDPAAKEQP